MLNLIKNLYVRLLAPYEVKMAAVYKALEEGRINDARFYLHAEIFSSLD